MQRELLVPHGGGPRGESGGRSRDDTQEQHGVLANHHPSQLTRRTYTSNYLRTQSLWKLSGSQGDVWIQANVHVGSSPIVQFQFKGQIGEGYQGDIAIDDLVYLNCQGLGTNKG